ncbi:MAG: class I SAM-dependent methyltransferase [Betaproteobacteria bacterium]|nr:class I SAM-dependent methyltransferase [Betaproteobacteria bacterium]
MTRVGTRADYARRFDEERTQTYPMMDAVEATFGYALDRTVLEAAARVLACPLKVHAPCWQHGRLLYAATRRYLQEAHEQTPVALLDIGTAKGFSALCLYWALRDAGRVGTVTSVDVIDPASAVMRNSVADCEGPTTLAQVLAPWPEAQAIHFHQRTGIEHLTRRADRIHVAFVDGKHAYGVVREEGTLLAARQRPGDLALFDDCQIDGVQRAINALGGLYHFEIIEVKPERAYAVGVRR